MGFSSSLKSDTKVDVNPNNAMVMTRIFSLSIVAAAGLLLTGCYDVEETVANIYVVRLDGDAGTYQSGGATVRRGGGEPVLTPPKPPQMRASSFNFSDLYVAGQSGFAVLSIGYEKATCQAQG